MTINKCNYGGCDKVAVVSEYPDNQPFEIHRCQEHYNADVQRIKHVRQMIEDLKSGKIKPPQEFVDAINKLKR